MEEKKEEVKQNAEVETGNEANNKTDTAPEKPQINMDAQVIGELETEKQKGVFGLIIFFVILIGVTFGLPYIKEYLDKRNAPVQDNTPQEKTENSNEQIPEEEEIVYYEIGTDTTFDFNDLNFKVKG